MELPVREPGASPFVPPRQFYIPADGVLEKVMWAVAHNLPVLLIGETGVGKTLVIRHLAHQTRNGLRRVNLNGMTTVDEFVGKLMINQAGTYWTNGVLVQAMEAGDWLLIDEINACLPEIAFCLHSLLDDDRMIVLTEYDGRIVRPHPNFRLFASMNPSEDRKYGGTKPLNEALLDRFPVTLRMSYLPEDAEVEAVCVQSANPDREMVRRMVRCAADLRAAIAEERLMGSCSTRRIIDWARMAWSFSPLEAAWPTLLSKVSPFDARVIQDVVENYFGPSDAGGSQG
ncbi:MAG: AAA family ATPase [Nitrospinota bacterium]